MLPGSPQSIPGAWWGDARRERGDGRKDGGIGAPSLHVGRCEAGTELELHCPKLQLHSSVLQLHPGMSREYLLLHYNCIPCIREGHYPPKCSFIPPKCSFIPPNCSFIPPNCS